MSVYKLADHLFLRDGTSDRCVCGKDIWQHVSCRARTTEGSRNA